VPHHFEKGSASYEWNQSWTIPSAVFVAAIALQNKFPLSRKFSRNPGIMPNKCFVDLGKYMGVFFVISFGGCCGSTVLTGASCWPSSNGVLVQKIAFVSG